MNNVLYIVYLLVLSLASLLAGFRYRKTDTGTRFITFFLWLGLITELAARIAAKKYHNNLPVLNISCIIEWVLICLYYNFSIGSIRKINAGVVLAALGIAFGVLNLMCFQSIYRINSNFLFMECLGIVSLSLYGLYKLLEIDDDHLRLNRKTQFWIAIILVMYQCGALWSWGVYDYYEKTDKLATNHLEMLLLLNSIITYSLLFVVYLYYPKMKRIYVY